MVAALALVGLNTADVLLLRMNSQLGEIALNPLAPPLMTNLAARCLMVVILILTMYLIKKPYLLWWLNFVVLLVIGFHAVGSYVSSFAVTAP